MIVNLATAASRKPEPRALIDPTAVAFDIDSVVADTMKLFIAIVHDEFGIDGLRYTDITSYNLVECLDLEEAVIDAAIRRILDGDHAAPLEPLTGAPEVLTRLGRRHRPLLFVSARPHLGAVYEWLCDHLPALGGAAIEAVATGSYEAKADVLKQRKVSFFVEDRLETCFQLESVGITPILFRQPWNRRPHPFVEVADWNELEALIAF